MADTVKSVAMFAEVFKGCIELEKTRAGLSKRFFSAFVQFINEHSDLPREELVKEYLSTMTEVENTLQSKLTEAFGAEADVKSVLPSWVQYKSDCKRAIELADKRDILRCNGIAAVKSLVQEVRNAMKEKGGTESGKPAAVDTSKLPEDVANSVAKALEALSKMSHEQAKKCASDFRNAAWALLKNTSPKMNAAAAASGGAAKNKSAA